MKNESIKMLIDTLMEEIQTVDFQGNEFEYQDESYENSFLLISVSQVSGAKNETKIGQLSNCLQVQKCRFTP